jgi:hemerythrin-like metal-binding protein
MMVDMSLFRWGVQHEIFLPEIDAEHRAIFSAGEQLYQLLVADGGSEKIGEAMHHLAEVAEVHFLHEERLMRDSEFEPYGWHRQQHQTVRRRMKGLKPTDPAAVRATLEFMAGWLRDHTSVADRIMASHVRNWTRRQARWASASSGQGLADDRHWVERA